MPPPMPGPARTITTTPAPSPSEPNSSNAAPLATGSTSGKARVTPTPDTIEQDWLVDSKTRPFTKAELSLGALTLPRARFTLPTDEGTNRADLTLLLTLRQLFQWNPHFAVGAAIDWGLRPTSDKITIESARGPIERSHTRNYLMVTGLVRFIPVVNPEYEIWVGASGGALVVSDRYVSKLDRSAIPVVVGPQATHVSSEGGTVGLGVGFEYRFARSWAVGGFTQQMLWFLPEQKRCAQTLECASVGGRLFSFELGLTATYRLRL